MGESSARSAQHLLTGARDVAPDATRRAPLSAVLLDDTVLVLTTEGLFGWTDLVRPRRSMT